MYACIRIIIGVHVLCRYYTCMCQGVYDLYRYKTGIGIEDELVSRIKILFIYHNYDVLLGDRRVYSN